MQHNKYGLVDIPCDSDMVTPLQSDYWCPEIAVILLLLFFLSQEFQDQIKAVSFKDVVVSGRELSGALITALINVYIKDSASVDTVSAHLRDLCPLLYSSDDSICSKVPVLVQIHTLQHLNDVFTVFARSVDEDHKCVCVCVSIARYHLSLS